ncbi:hypothetical protein niasHT_020790 [Heterodera trifolii]|uniref:guanylate cyclase n=1 Tax=Heterodera trifolii TaxID=157864 RepID=A0ABD2KF31_9BILA
MRPLQVVNLMNELYTIFDAIIDEHDVYKVESIGDGYLCVSGLPNRNGTLHAKHCADMAIKFIQALLNFRILDHPNERVRLRVGLHSGPCVAGVVANIVAKWQLVHVVLPRWKHSPAGGANLRLRRQRVYCVGRAERTAASRSRHSIRSNQTNISSPTHSTIGSLARSRIFSLYSYNGEKCIVRSFGSTTMAKALTVAQMTECRTMRLFGHENVNRFLGLSLDGPNVLAVWNFCLRGSIRDVILSENAMVKDVMFIQSAIKEICEGIHFLHNSPLQFHGGLKSSACLINDRWQVKISYFGLRWLKSSQKNGAKGK